MAHPKHRTSKQRRNKRRTHDAITVTAIAKCSNSFFVILLITLLSVLMAIIIRVSGYLKVPMLN